MKYILVSLRLAQPLVEKAGKGMTTTSSSAEKNGRREPRECGSRQWECRRHWNSHEWGISAGRLNDTFCRNMLRHDRHDVNLNLFGPENSNANTSQRFNSCGFLFPLNQTSERSHLDIETENIFRQNEDEKAANFYFKLISSEFWFLTVSRLRSMHPHGVYLVADISSSPFRQLLFEFQAQLQSAEESRVSKRISLTNEKIAADD